MENRNSRLKKNTVKATKQTKRRRSLLGKGVSKAEEMLCLNKWQDQQRGYEKQRP